MPSGQHPRKQFTTKGKNAASNPHDLERELTGTPRFKQARGGSHGLQHEREVSLQSSGAKTEACLCNGCSAGQNTARKCCVIGVQRSFDENNVSVPQPLRALLILMIVFCSENECKLAGYVLCEI